MAALTNQSVATSFEQVLHVDTDGGGNTTTLVPVKDGDNGTTFAIQISTDTVCIDNPTASSATEGGILRLQSDDGTVMASGDRLGVIEFAGAETTGAAPTITVGARIEAVTDAIWSTSENGANLNFYTTDGDAVQTQRMTILAGGNVGIGVTPETSHASYTSVQIGGLANIISTTAQSANSYTALANNAYVDGTPQWEYIVTDEASLYKQTAGIHTFSSAASGSADAAITFTDVMKLDVNSRISLSNNDNNSYNTVFGKLAFNAGSDNTSDYNTIIGEDAAGTGTVNGASYNTAVGYKALEDITSGDANIALGMYACSSMLTGLGNIAIGAYDGTTAGPMRLSTAASNCIAMGTGSLAAIVTSAADGTIAIGYKSLNALTSGASNTVVGYQSGLAISKGNYNTVSGYLALSTETVSDRSTAFGYAALQDQIIGAGDNAISGNTAIGFSAGRENVTGTHNTYIGNSAGEGSNGNSNSSNTAVGSKALLAVTTGSSNVAIGTTAMVTATTAGENVAIGYEALGDVQTGSGANVAIGYYAMRNVDEGTGDGDADYNVAIGYDALKGGDFAGNDRQLRGNVAIGAFALDATDDNAQTGTVAIGESALSALTSGAGNVAIGYQSLLVCTDGKYNTALGYQALGSAMNVGDSSTAVGYQSLYSADPDTNDHGSNTAVGKQSGYGISTGTGNTLVGANAGNSGSDDLTTGDNNTFIGNEANGSAVGAANQTVIGSTTVGQADNSVTLGNAAVTAVYMSSDSQALVHSAGIQFAGTQVANAGANVLDDYEEGTWTCVITDGSNAMTMVTTTGYYTKVGNLVTVSGYFNTNSLGSASGNIRMTGLPFTIVNNDAAQSGGAVGYTAGLAITAGHSVTCRGEKNSTDIYLNVFDATAGTTAMQASEWTADGGIIMGLTYRTA
jgi:hypothetical protein